MQKAIIKIKPKNRRKEKKTNTGEEGILDPYGYNLQIDNRSYQVKILAFLSQEAACISFSEIPFDSLPFKLVDIDIPKDSIFLFFHQQPWTKQWKSSISGSLFYFLRVDKSFHNLCRIGDLEGVMEYVDSGIDINVVLHIQSLILRC